MSRVIVVHESVIDEVNLGNADVARRWLDLRAAGAQFWIPRDVYNQRSEADRRLLLDMGVQIPADDMEYWKRQKAKVPNMPGRAQYTVALALDKKAELMTMDRRLSAVYLKQGVVPGMTSIQPGRGPKDFNHARRLLQLENVPIGGKIGNVLPTAEAAKPATNLGQYGRGTQPTITGKNQGPANGPRTPGGARTTAPTTPQTARVGEPLTAPPSLDHVPSRVNTVVGAGAQLIAKVGLRGVDNFIQGWIGGIQKERYQKKWDQIKPGVEAELTRDPTLGAWVVVYYSQRVKQGQENETSLTHTSAFQAIAVHYGHTEGEARRNAGGRVLAAGQGQYTPQAFWIEPKAPISVAQPHKQFTALGLATFVSGKEYLWNVVWKGISGFDWKIHDGLTVLNVSTKVRADFYYLQPPDEMNFLFYKSIKRVSIDTSMEEVGGGLQINGDYVEVPAVDIGSANLAMVYPADDYTVSLFKQGPPVKDKLKQLLAFYDLSLVRWVSPETMHLLKRFPK